MLQKGYENIASACSFKRVHDPNNFSCIWNIQYLEIIFSDWLFALVPCFNQALVLQIPTSVN